MPDYQILSPIQRDGKRRTQGTIALSAADAAPLLALRAIAGPIDTPAADVHQDGLDESRMSAEQEASAEPEHVDNGLGERELALRAVIADMLASDPEQTDPFLWTKTKRPDLRHIRKQPELSDVSRDEADAAFDALRAE